MYFATLQMEAASKQVLFAVDLISNAILNNLQAGDPPAIVSLRTLSLAVQKNLQQQRSNTDLSTNMGAFNISELNINASCFTQKVRVLAL